MNNSLVLIRCYSTSVNERVVQGTRSRILKPQGEIKWSTEHLGLMASLIILCCQRIVTFTLISSDPNCVIVFSPCVNHLLHKILTVDPSTNFETLNLGQNLKSINLKVFLDNTFIFLKHIRKSNCFCAVNHSLDVHLEYFVLYLRGHSFYAQTVYV